MGGGGGGGIAPVVKELPVVREKHLGKRKSTALPYKLQPK